MVAVEDVVADLDGFASISVDSAESVDSEVDSSEDSVGGAGAGAASIGIADGSTLNRSPGFRRMLGLLT